MRCLNEKKKHFSFHLEASVQLQVFYAIQQQLIYSWAILPNSSNLSRQQTFDYRRKKKIKQKKVKRKREMNWFGPNYLKPITGRFLTSRLALH